MTRVLVVGGGAAGHALIEQMAADPGLGWDPVGVLDDAPELQGALVAGIPVLGGVAALAQCTTTHAVARVVVAMPSAAPAVLRGVADAALACHLDVWVLPSLRHIVHGPAYLVDARPLDVTDLLRRSPLQSGDTLALTALLAGATVLITGAGGSIGSELSVQVAALGAKRLVLLGHGENSILQTVATVTRQGRAVQIVPIIGDVRHAPTVLRVLQQEQPSLVLHAAAHKHVPLLENQICEAVLNNVGGSWTVLQTCCQQQVSAVLTISTDKAVEPSSIMGATKRVTEFMLAALAPRYRGTRLLGVRFGNVLGSRGSLVPIISEQLRQGGPVTLTDPGMRRFFMVATEAAELVLQTFVMGRSGQIAVLDMGAEIAISDLVADLMQLLGYPVGSVPVTYIGRRPGEKLTEKLIGEHEIVETVGPLRLCHAPPPRNFRRDLARLLRAAERQQPAVALSVLQEMTGLAQIDDLC